jgi:hypothetical protein
MESGSVIDKRVLAGNIPPETDCSASNFSTAGWQMPFPDGCYAPEVVKVMEAALDAAWQEIERVAQQRTVNYTGLRRIMEIRIMAAIKDGVKDPTQLTLLALMAIKGLY